MSPDSQVAALVLGELLRKQGAYAEAEPYLRRAEQAGNPAAAFAFGRTLFAQRRLEEAEVELRRAVDHYGDLSALTAIESDDGAGIAGLEALVGAEEPLADSWRQVRTTSDPADVRRFVALCAEAMRE